MTQKKKKTTTHSARTFKEIEKKAREILSKPRSYTYEEMLEQERRIQSGGPIPKKKKK
jgi:hypothetical protein